MNTIFKKQSYQDKLEAATSVFQKALTDAKNLMTEMQDEVAANVEAISVLRERNEQINKIQTETNTLIKNLNKLLGI